MFISPTLLKPTHIFIWVRVIRIIGILATTYFCFIYIHHRVSNRYIHQRQTVMRKGPMNQPTERLQTKRESGVKQWMHGETLHCVNRQESSLGPYLAISLYNSKTAFYVKLWLPLIFLLCTSGLFFKYFLQVFQLQIK